MSAPSPLHWTLRLKSHKTTILLHVDPLQTFSSIKSTLMTALQQTSFHDAQNREIPLPESAEEIQLGRPVNVNDPNSGFVLGKWERSGNAGDEGEGDGDGDGEEVEEVVGKGKGKAIAGAKGKGRPSKKSGDGTAAELATEANILQCPKGAGLRDGAVLAFRWPGIAAGVDQDWVDDAERDGDVDMVGAGGEEGKKVDMWNVRIATFEDAYGVENGGDVGGRKAEFVG